MEKNGLKWDWARARFLNQCWSHFLQWDHFLSSSPRCEPETETASWTRAQELEGAKLPLLKWPFSTF